MKQLASGILFVFYSIGVIFSPLGNFSCMKYVPEMYTRCMAEDPDIQAADFIFEHLLNLESLVEFLENGNDEDTDAPGQPFQLPQTAIQTMVVLHNPLQISFSQYNHFATGSVYSIFRNVMKPGLYINDIFHPPSV